MLLQLSRPDSGNAPLSVTSGSATNAVEESGVSIYKLPVYSAELG